MLEGWEGEGEGEGEGRGGEGMGKGGEGRGGDCKKKLHPFFGNALICYLHNDFIGQRISKYKNTITLFVCPYKILHKHCFQFLLGSL